MPTQVALPIKLHIPNNRYLRTGRMGIRLCSYIESISQGINFVNPRLTKIYKNICNQSRLDKVNTQWYSNGMSDNDIIQAIIHSLWQPFSYTIAYHTCALGQEADMIVVQRSGYAEEIEIKVTLSDFRADMKNKADKHLQLQRGIGKRVWQQSYNDFVTDWSDPKPQPIRRYWFAVPEELQEKVTPELPNYAGLIVAKMHGSYRRAEIVKQAPNLPNSRKVNDVEMQSILRSMYARAWKQFFRECRSANG